jgi:hypothetical protein
MGRPSRDVKMKRWQKVNLLWLGALVLVGGGYFVFHWIEYARFKPPPMPCSWEDVLARVPRPVEVRVFQVNGREYLDAVGPMPSLWTVPSGPPSYVFGKNGMLVDWSGDSGEEGSDYLGFHSSRHGRRIPMEQVPAWFNRDAASNGGEVGSVGSVPRTPHSHANSHSRGAADPHHRALQSGTGLALK